MQKCQQIEVYKKKKHIGLVCAWHNQSKKELAKWQLSNRIKQRNETKCTKKTLGVGPWLVEGG